MLPVSFEKEREREHIKFGGTEKINSVRQNFNSS
jgi:hypothetical protein